MTNKAQAPDCDTHEDGGPVGWNTDAEWEMELQVFHACGRADVPKDVRRLIAKMWRQYCLVAAPPEHPPLELAQKVSDEQAEIVRQTYMAKVKEYERDFNRDNLPTGYWEEKYGTNLHSISLGEQWAMRIALDTAFPVSEPTNAAEPSIKTYPS